MTFIDGIAGSQEPTLQVQAQNYFRFHGDGAQWNAGLGDRLHNEAGWDTVAVIADDYSFGWTSAAGFIADFCAVGGDVVTRVFPPLGTTDYSSFIQQLPDPDEVDGYFWVGRRHRHQGRARGVRQRQGRPRPAPSTPATCSSARRWPPRSGRTSPVRTSAASQSLPGDVTTPAIRSTSPAPTPTWDTLAAAPPVVRPGRRQRAGLRLRLRLLRGRQGPRCRRSKRSAAICPTATQRCARRLATMTARGAVRRRHARREPPGHHRHLRAAARPRRGDGEVVSRPLPSSREVDQTFGGTFTPGHAAARSREPALRGAGPAVGRATRSRSSTACRSE